MWVPGTKEFVDLIRSWMNLGSCFGSFLLDVLLRSETISTNFRPRWLLCCERVWYSFRFAKIFYFLLLFTNAFLITIHTSFPNSIISISLVDDSVRPVLDVFLIFSTFCYVRHLHKSVSCGDRQPWIHEHVGHYLGSSICLLTVLLRAPCWVHLVCLTPQV